MPDVTFTPDPELAGDVDADDGEFVEVNEVYLADGQCWVSDPDALDPASGVPGVIAIQFRDGGLYYMDGETRRWHNAEAAEPGKPARKLKTVN